MRTFIIDLLTAAGLTLLTWADQLKSPPGRGPGHHAGRGRPGRRQLGPVVDLPRSEYRIGGRQPSQWEVIKLGLSIMFSSWGYALGVTI